MTGNQWGQARIEVAALRAFILERLDAGYTVRRIWQELNSQGKVTVALSNFYVQVDKIRQERKACVRTLAPVSTPRVMVATKPAAAPKRSADTTIPQFHHDPVAEPLVLTPAVEDADLREQDDHAS